MDSSYAALFGLSSYNVDTVSCENCQINTLRSESGSISLESSLLPLIGVDVGIGSPTNPLHALYTRNVSLIDGTNNTLLALDNNKLLTSVTIGSNLEYSDNTLGLVESPNLTSLNILQPPGAEDYKTLVKMENGYLDIDSKAGTSGQGSINLRGTAINLFGNTYLQGTAILWNNNALRFNNTSNTFSTYLKGDPSIASNISFTLPSSLPPSTGGVPLICNSSGAMSWNDQPLKTTSDVTFNNVMSNYFKMTQDESHYGFITMNNNYLKIGVEGEGGIDITGNNIALWGTLQATKDVAILYGKNLQFWKSDNSNHCLLRASEGMTQNLTFTLPSWIPSGDTFLKCDGSGNLFFSSNISTDTLTVNTLNASNINASGTINGSYNANSGQSVILQDTPLTLKTAAGNKTDIVCNPVGNTTFTLPYNNPQPQSVLYTDGYGNTSWSNGMTLVNLTVNDEVSIGNGLSVYEQDTGISIRLNTVAYNNYIRYEVSTIPYWSVGVDTARNYRLINENPSLPGGGCYYPPNTLTGNWTGFSDRRRKKNINYDLLGALDKINSLKPCDFHYLHDSDEAPKRFGFIAQEVQPIFPHCISSDNEGMLGLAMGDLLPHMVKAVQELTHRVIELENTIKK